MTIPAVAAAAYLDGVAIPNAREWRVIPVEGRVLRTSSGGSTREIVAYQAAGLPPVRSKRRFAIRWEHIADADGLRELLAVPGEHSLILWRREQLAYLGDGSRVEWTLPNSWSQATDSVTPPGGLAASLFASVWKVGIDGTEITATSTASATFDASDPAAGQVWIRTGGSDVKIGDVAPAGTWIYARVVPVYTVLRDAPEETVLSKPLVEPAAVRLVEV